MGSWLLANSYHCARREPAVLLVPGKIVGN